MKEFKGYHMSQDAKIISAELPGEKSVEIIEFHKKHEGKIVTYPVKMPIALKRAKGAIIEDEDGNHFIDFFSGCGVLNVGHSNEDVLKYVREQQDNLIHALDFPTKNKMTTIINILSQLPEPIRDDFKVSFCASTGSDAVEAAIKLAKIKTGRSTIIAFQGSYHGMTAGALAVTSDINYRRKIESQIPNVHFIPYSYCYRCPFNKIPGDCKMDCATFLEQILENPHSGVPKPAAILIEPIQSEGGNIVPKDGYLDAIIEIAHKHDVLVIFDEIQSGFFRTGKFFASQVAQSVPDIYILSKGLGGIGFPISAILFKRNIEAWSSGDHIGTFRGNQVSLAASNGAFDFAERNDISSHVSEIGEYLIEKIKDALTGNPYVGDIRGTGLIIGIEYVKNKRTKAPFPELVSEIRKACFKKGLLFEVGGHFGNVIRFVPSLIINEEIVDNAMKIFSEVNNSVKNKYQPLSTVLV